MSRSTTVNAKDLKPGDILTGLMPNLPIRVAWLHQKPGDEIVEVGIEHQDALGVVKFDITETYQVLVEEKVNRCVSIYSLGDDLPVCRCQRTEHLTGRHFNDEGALPIQWG